MPDAGDTARTLFAAEGLSPVQWSNEADERYDAHDHPYDKMIVCVAGSITFHTPHGDVALGVGDRLDLPAGTVHWATVGQEGVTCWEAHR